MSVPTSSTGGGYSISFRIVVEDGEEEGWAPQEIVKSKKDMIPADVIFIPTSISSWPTRSTPHLPFVLLIFVVSPLKDLEAFEL